MYHLKDGDGAKMMDLSVVIPTFNEVENVRTRGTIWPTIGGLGPKHVKPNTLQDQFKYLLKAVIKYGDHYEAALQ
jgi:hypothetical protein